MHKVGNKIECNNMHGERIKRVCDVYCLVVNKWDSGETAFIHYVQCRFACLGLL